MASRKDMRRDDLVVPYRAPAPKDSSGDLGSTLSSTLPMAAMFTRNKYIGWGSVVFAVQSWLSESPEQRATASQPAYFSVGMSILALTVAYLPLFLPPPAVLGAGAGTGTGPAAAMPPS